MYMMITRWYGTFVFQKLDREWRSVDILPAEKDPSLIASELQKINEGELLARERVLSEKYSIDIVEEERLGDALEAELGTVSVELPSPEEKGFDMGLLAEANMIMVSLQTGTSDANILSAIGGLTEVDASLNTIVERINEWYTKYWPGISEFIEKKEVISALADSPYPESVLSALRESSPDTAEKLEREGLPDIEGIIDLSGISPLAFLALSHWKAREEMETYVGAEMELCAPNLSMIAGPLVGARLIDSAGGLERLAKLPSSTVQVLGAEKMFFKFLKEGGKPPKHGVLFQHPWVHSLPQRKRGKMARSIASASSLAARMDAYGGGDASGIKKKLEKRAESIREMEIKPGTGGGRQPPFREGWWANKGGRKGSRKRGRRKR
ncbi:MAG: NOP5/NOP56 family protein [Candidatus Thermoplasmatota archaeon]|nr:NOP5/NOP56 family protein [Candidatus Thermoplasmatota archaeon]